MAVNYYDIVKKIKGGLSLTIPTFDATGVPREFFIPHDLKSIRVPRLYALGIFADPVLERLYKEGAFTVEPAAEFEKEVAEIYMPVEDKKPVIEEKTILDYLKKGNRVKVKEIVQENGLNKDKLIVITRENISEISTSMVKFLEELLGVELQVENE